MQKCSPVWSQVTSAVTCQAHLALRKRVLLVSVAAVRVSAMLYVCTYVRVYVRVPYVCQPCCQRCRVSTHCTQSTVSRPYTMQFHLHPHLQFVTDQTFRTNPIGHTFHSFPSPFLPLFSLSFPSPSPPLPSLPNAARGLGERCKLPSGVRGRAPAANVFCSYFKPRKRVWW